MPTQALMPSTPNGIARITAQIATVAARWCCEEPMMTARTVQMGAAITQMARLLTYRNR